MVMRIFTDSLGNLVFFVGDQFVQMDSYGKTFCDFKVDVPEAWDNEYVPTKEFTTEEVQSIVDTLLEVLQNK
jgi:hypothetical protein